MARKNPDEPLQRVASPAVIRLDVQVGLQYLVDHRGADFVFNVLAAETPRQRVTRESINLNQSCERRLDVDPATGNRCLRVHASPGNLQLDYSVTVDLVHHFAEPDSLGEVTVQNLPVDVIGYLNPSRYCPSDRLLKFAAIEFGGLPPGYSRVLAVRNWVRGHVAFVSNTSNSTTTALDTLVERVGVCRDFAHLMITLCRAINIPARFVTGTDYGSDPALGPPDFHAYVEVFLEDRWYLIDPSNLAVPMGLVRFATGRDAADVPFAMVFGNVQTTAPYIRTTWVDGSGHSALRPMESRQALSTDEPGAPGPFLGSAPIASRPSA